MSDDIGKWRYGHILVYRSEDPEEEDVCELVELYLTADGEPHSWSTQPFLGTVASIKMALKDAEAYPVVTKFYDEGEFEWDIPSGGWNWRRKIVLKKRGGQMNDDTNLPHLAPSVDLLLQEEDPLFPDAGNTAVSEHRHVKESCIAYQQGSMGCPDCYCDATCQDDDCYICGGNTPERIDDQIAWMEKKMNEQE